MSTTTDNLIYAPIVKKTVECYLCGRGRSYTALPGVLDQYGRQVYSGCSKYGNVAFPSYECPGVNRQVARDHCQP